jgi:hypothetical protein
MAACGTLRHLGGTIDMTKAKTKPKPYVFDKEAHRRDRWDAWMGEQWEGKPSGNATHAIKCYNTPLEAGPILDLLVDNLGYFGDPYYRPLTDPVEQRVEEYYDSLKAGGGHD